MAVDVLIVGGGGREHALAWKLRQSPRLGKLYVAPGNAGTELIAENVPIQANDIHNLARFASEKKINLTVVGPDDPLALGIVDVFKGRGLRIFGPSKAAAQVESSKKFSKQLMKEANIPTAEYESFNDHNMALAYVRRKKLPLVIKASGLALGKGVYICKTMGEVEQALKELLVDKVHKEAGNDIIIEGFLEGPETSIHALFDGASAVVFPPSQDHKAILDGDMGKNTGGMGVICPVPWAKGETMDFIERRIVEATFNHLTHNGIYYSGLLYPGLKMTLEGPKVLEYNARFGDPECQVYMRLLKNDVLDLLEACVDGGLDAIKPDWKFGYGVNIVVASGGYPDAYQKGYPITGIELAEKVPEVVVFHAGTVNDGVLKTAGGRVLGVSAVAATLQEALDRAYLAISKIHFEGMYFRKDIGASALKYDNSLRI